MGPSSGLKDKDVHAVLLPRGMSKEGDRGQIGTLMSRVEDSASRETVCVQWQPECTGEIYFIALDLGLTLSQWVQ